MKPVPQNRRPDHPDYERLRRAFPRSRNNFLGALHADLRKLRSRAWRIYSHGTLSLSDALSHVAIDQDPRTRRSHLRALERAGVVVVTQATVHMPHFYIDAADRQRGIARAEHRRSYLAHKARERRRRQAQPLSPAMVQVPVIVDEIPAYTLHKHRGHIRDQHSPTQVRRRTVPPLGLTHAELDHIEGSICGDAPPKAAAPQMLKGDVACTQADSASLSLVRWDPSMQEIMRRLEEKIRRRNAQRDHQPQPPAAPPVSPPPPLRPSMQPPRARIRATVRSSGRVSTQWVQQNVLVHPQFAGLKLGVLQRMGIQADSMRIGLEHMLECKKTFNNPCGALIHTALQYQRGTFKL